MNPVVIEEAQQRFSHGMGLAEELILQIDDLSEVIDELQTDLHKAIEKVLILQEKKRELLEQNEDVLFCNLRLVKEMIQHKNIKDEYERKKLQRESLQNALYELNKSLHTVGIMLGGLS